MKKISSKTSALSLTALSILLTACGGGGDDQTRDNPPPAPKPKPLIGAPAKPDAAEQGAFNASKIQHRQITGLITTGGPLPSNRLTAGGKILSSIGLESPGRYAFHADAGGLPSGFATLPGLYEDFVARTSQPASVRSYQGFRSGSWVAYGTAGNYMTNNTYGVTTPIADFPAAGQATYRGTAYDQDDWGTFAYHVNFGNKTGSGAVEGLDRYGKITMPVTQIQPYTDKDSRASYMRTYGRARAEKGQYLDYSMEFYGNKAEEVAGYGVNVPGGYAIGFHGTRGEISE